jgi:hypothetical protein
MRATPKDILIWCSVRSILTEYARTASHLEPNELVRLRSTLIEEINAIHSGEPLPEIWKQATKAATDADGIGGGVMSYALQMLGLWPE